MGRDAGWIAVYSGIAGGADAILVPEVPIDLDSVIAQINARRARGKNFSIVVVAEGAKMPASDAKGVADSSDQSARDRHVGAHTRRSRAVEDVAASEQHRLSHLPAS